MPDGRNGSFGVEYPSTETYVTLNGLSITDDVVLGDYEIWSTVAVGTTWTITARSARELLWIAGGTISEFEKETERLTATVTNYTDSDIVIDAYGESRNVSWTRSTLEKGYPEPFRCRWFATGGGFSTRDSLSTANPFAKTTDRSTHPIVNSVQPYLCSCEKETHDFNLHLRFCTLVQESAPPGPPAPTVWHPAQRAPRD